MTRLQHGHTLVLPTTTGTGWVRMLVVTGVLVAVAFVMLRPFIPAMGSVAPLAVTVATGGAAVLTLVISDGLDVPQQVAGVAVLALGMPVALARRRPRGTSAWPERRVAPWVVLGVTVYVATLLLRALPTGADVKRLSETAVFVGAVGLSWLVVSDPGSPRMRAGQHILASVLGHLVLASATLVALAGVPR